MNPVICWNTLTIMSPNILNALEESDKKSDQNLPLNAPPSRGLANKQSIELWHRRLGHRNIPDIRKMFHQNLTKGDVVALQGQPPSFCEACVIGKAKRLPFPKQSKPKEWKLLERIDIDE